MVIISWIIGALLPIIALFMTSMVANNIQLMNGTNEEKKDEPVNEPINDPTKEDIIVKRTTEDTPKPVAVEQKKEEKKEEQKPQTKVIIQPKEKEIIREVINEPVKVEEPEQQKREMGNMSADTLTQI